MLNSTRTTAIMAVMGLGLAAAGAYAGVSSGRTRDRVDAFSTDAYSLRFEEGQVVLVTVSGDGDTDLDLVIKDAFGNIVGADLDATDQCVVIFRAECDGPFSIEIRNLGSVYNVYDLEVGATD